MCNLRVIKDLDTELQAIVHPLSDDEAMAINLM